MYLVQWLPQLKSIKDFAKNHLLSLYPEQIHNRQLALAVVQMSAIAGGEKPAMRSSPPPTAAMMTAKAAQKLFFDHFNHIDALAKRRFPNDENRQYEASQYVREALAADDWKKLRAFEGNDSQFTIFIATVTNRLLTDFQRHKEGRVRPNAWLNRQKDPIYQKAYQLLHKEKYSKREAVEILLTTETDRERWKIEEVVSEVSAHYPRKEKDQEVPFDEDGDNDDDNPTQTVFLQKPATYQASLEAQDERHNEQAILEALFRLLDNEMDDNDIPLELRELLGCLAKYVRLTEEQCLILRLYYKEGLSVKKIAQRLTMTDKQSRYRIENALKALSQALKQCGIL